MRDGTQPAKKSPTASSVPVKSITWLFLLACLRVLLPLFQFLLFSLWICIAAFLRKKIDLTDYSYYLSGLLADPDINSDRR